MKKSISILLCLCIVFGSFSFIFASPVSWDTNDSSNLAQIRNTLVSGGALYNLINAINSNVLNLNSNLVTLMGWLDPSSGGSTTAILNQILSMLSYTDAAQGLKSWLADIWQTESVYLPDLLNIRQSLSNYYLGQTWNASTARLNAHRYLIGGIDQGNYSVPRILGPGQIGSQTYSWLEGSPIGNLAALLQKDIQLNADMWSYRWAADLQDYLNSQSYYNWETLQSASFTPTSSTNGLYNWLKNIQIPVARLSYVLASDQRIEAQELAADNEQAVVDYFIDSSGSGAASTNDISAVSDLSAGYKDSFGSDASVSGIFDIFDSDHMGWFSQETKNQLDTTTPSRSKSSESDTPLLDQQIQDIYKGLGVTMP